MRCVRTSRSVGSVRFRPREDQSACRVPSIWPSKTAKTALNLRAELHDRAAVDGCAPARLRTTARAWPNDDREFFREIQLTHLGGCGGDVIRDLEEQLLRIPRPEAREQMAEAVRCYHAGAHRAAIVMAFAAAMDDLRRKLVDLAGSGGASSDLKAAVGHIESTFALQRAFEEDAIATAQVHAQLISPDEAKALQSYLKLRHLCAHPSGYVATAEEARAVIARVTDSVLSRPATLEIGRAHV